MRYIITFIIGALGYGTLEVLWRGYTHWTMSITGGLCLVMIYVMNGVLDFLPLAAKCAIGSFMITFVEFAVGLLVNLILKWNVWDYSSVPFNLMGQICLPYTVLWYFLCIPVIWLCTGLEKIL